MPQDLSATLRAEHPVAWGAAEAAAAGEGMGGEGVAPLMCDGEGQGVLQLMEDDGTVGGARVCERVGEWESVREGERERIERASVWQAVWCVYLGVHA